MVSSVENANQSEYYVNWKKTDEMNLDPANPKFHTMLHLFGNILNY